MTRDGSFLLLLLCFFLSGLAGLIYETAWTQQFALVFGTSELAVAAVLGAYMAGLALGAAVIQRFVDRIQKPVRLYALLELGIALSALAVPSALGLASRLQVVLIGGLEVPPDAGSLASALFYLFTAFCVLGLPTALMGATLPLLARFAVRSDEELGQRVGWLYAVNTVGAAAGTLIAAFVLLPRLDLGLTVWVAVGTNLVVFVAALLLAGRRDGAFESTQADAARRDRPPPKVHWILPCVLISGFVSLTWEVLWTRVLSHLLGGTIYAFGTMLATFLVGIAVGSAVGSQLAGRPDRARLGFAISQLGIAATSLAAFVLADRLPGVTSGLAESGASLARAGSLAALTLLPGACFVGATFPFAVRILARGPHDAGAASARVYGWNTVGAILGSVVAGFVLLPTLSIAGTATLAVASSLFLALATACLPRPRKYVLAIAAAGCLLLLVFVRPQTPWQLIRTAPLAGKPAKGEVVYYAVGRSATVLLVSENGYWRLSTNGLPEAAIQPRGSRVGNFTGARWMALLPSLSRPEAKSMMIVGLGAGLTLGSVPKTFDDIHVVELEPEVVAANRRMADVRHPDPLADPRLKIHVNDARSALTLTDRTFDAIVSQPSHPWTSGASHLFTREFFSLVRQRLTSRGVFVQWIGVRYVDPDLLRTLIATLGDVFAHVELYQPYPGGSLLFLCGDESLTSAESIERGLAGAADAWRRMGIFTPDDVLIDRILTSESSRQFSDGAALNTDARNWLKIRSPRILDRPLGTQGVQSLLADFDSLAELRGQPLEALHQVRQLIRRRSMPRARRMAESIQDDSARRVAVALVDLASRRVRAADRSLRLSLDSKPEIASEAIAALMLLHRGRLPAALAEHVERDPAAKVVAESWRRIRLGDPASVQGLEPQLRMIVPGHPLFDAATSQRIAWRRALGDATAAGEALDLLDPLLAYGASGPDLLRRARLAVTSGDREVAQASLIELSEVVGSGTQGKTLRRQGLAVLASFPPSWIDERTARLASRFSS